MQHRKIQWLYRELPELVEKDILSAASAERLKSHYGPVKVTSPARLAVVFFGILGALLIGSGIILLFAYNWTALGRLTRVFMSFAPLISGQLLVGWTLFGRRHSTAWREGSAAFLTMGVGASIALVGQTYHLPGDMASFLFAWVLLSLPLVYLLESSTVAVLYLFGTTGWAAAAQSQGGHALFYWPMLVAVLPFVWQHYNGQEKHPRTGVLVWVLCLNVSVGLGIAMERVLPGLWIVNYTALFALLYLVGRIGLREVSGQPIRVIGSYGTVFLATMLTFDEWWRRIGFHPYRGNSAYYREWYGIQDYLLALVLCTGVVLLAVRCVRRKDYAALAWVASPVLAVAGYAIASIEGQRFIAPILFNGYLLALGIIVLTSGLRRGQLFVANSGMAILALLFTVRFFDSDMGILVRAVAFIVVGAAFLGVNLWLSRCDKAQKVEGQS